MVTDVASIISEKVMAFQDIAVQFGKSRFLVCMDEYGKNSKEAETVERISNSFRCEVVQDGQAFLLYFHMDEDDPGGYLEIIDGGMPAPLAGGHHGTSHNPDGTTYASPTPVSKWNEPIEEYAKPASGIIYEIKTMLADLFKDAVKAAISESKSEILNIVKAQVKERLIHS